MLKFLLEPHSLPDKFRARRATDFFMLDPGETKVLCELDGPGCIRYIYTTMNAGSLRDMILRMWWDDEEEPSVECPLSDFFGIGHDLKTSDLNCLLFYNAPKYGYNCYIPMPFSSRARISLTNESEAQAGLHFQVNFHSYKEPLDVPWRFHAAWRRVYPAYRRGAGLDLLEAKGDGRLLACTYHVVKRDSDDRLSHGGADQLFIDGDTAEPNYIYGGGGEDYAHHAWGYSPGGGLFGGAHHVHPVPHVKRAEGEHAFEPHAFEQHDGGHYSIYRIYAADPVTFESSIRFTFGTCANEISSCVYWYQSEPHHEFRTLPAPDKRHFAERVTAEETWQPLRIEPTFPIAVLGPTLLQDDQPWTPDKSVDLGAEYSTNLKQAYGDVIRVPYNIRWRRSEMRGGFIDLAAIHRAKSAVRARGIWHDRTLPPGTTSHQLLRVKAIEERKVLLRVGFEDELSVWLGGKRIAELNHASPQVWDTEEVLLTLKSGANDLVISCTQRRPGQFTAWGIYIALCNREGEPLNDLEFEDFENLDPTPERWREAWPPDGMVDSDNYRDPLAIT